MQVGPFARQGERSVQWLSGVILLTNYVKVAGNVTGQSPKRLVVVEHSGS